MEWKYYKNKGLSFLEIKDYSTVNSPDNCARLVCHFFSFLFKC